MSKRILVIMIAVAAACSNAPTLPAPEYLRTPEGLPAFRVECRNDTSKPLSPVSSGGDVQALRLDGAVFESTGGIGSLLGGPPPEAPPGGRWAHLVVLHPDNVRATSRIELQGAVSVSNLGVPLSRGEHTVAFQCAGQWTSDRPFEW